MSTDAAWEEWGRRDPYFGVITSPEFRRAGMTEHAKRNFFASGEVYANQLFAAIRKHINPDFVPRTILDFGCGVGRVLIPFATVAESVVGLDVSPSMLMEARRNCDARQLRNVRLALSDDRLSAVSDTFDLIHSCIVFQHIPVDRGRTIFANLLLRLRPGGVGAIQITYSKAQFAATHGVAPPQLSVPVTRPPAALGDREPEIQMNPYNMNEILFLMQRGGVTHFNAEFTDHGGELGIFLLFQTPTGSP